MRTGKRSARRDHVLIACFTPPEAGSGLSVAIYALLGAQPRGSRPAGGRRHDYHDGHGPLIGLCFGAGGFDDLLTSVWLCTALRFMDISRV